MNTGSPSSKYEHRRASTLLRNIQNIRNCMGKKPIVSVTYENERISIKNSLPYLQCVLRLSCVVHGPIYGRFMSFMGFIYSLGYLWRNRPTRIKFMCTGSFKQFCLPVVVFLVPYLCTVLNWQRPWIASYTIVYYRNCSDSEMLGVGN